MNIQQLNSPRKFSCYLIGSESLLIQCAQILLEHGHTIYGIISEAIPLAEWARENSLPHLLPGEGLVDRLRQQPFDYFFNITKLTLIPPEILTLPRQAAINFHDGPLPR